MQARALSANAATLDRLLKPVRATVSSRRNLRRRFFSLAGGLTRKAHCLTLHLPLGQPVRQSPVESARPASPLLATPTASRYPTHYPIVSPSPAPGWPPAAVGQADIALRRRCGRQHPFGATTTPGAQLDWGRIKAAPSLSGSSHPLLRRGGQILAVDLGQDSAQSHLRLRINATMRKIPTSTPITIAAMIHQGNSTPP